MLFMHTNKELEKISKESESKINGISTIKFKKSRMVR